MHRVLVPLTLEMFDRANLFTADVKQTKLEREFDLGWEMNSRLTAVVAKEPPKDETDDGPSPRHKDYNDGMAVSVARALRSLKPT